MLTVAVSGAGGEVMATPDGSVCTIVCARRYDGDTPVRLTAIEHDGFRLRSWGGACSGAQRVCDTTVVSGGTAVTATFGPAVRVAARTRGSGEIVRLDETPCVGECQLDLIPGAQAVIGAQPGPGARFVGWRGLCTGSRRTCTVAVSLSAVDPTITAVFRDATRRA